MNGRRDHRAALLLADAARALQCARERAAETSTCAGRSLNERDRIAVMRDGMAALAALEEALSLLATGGNVRAALAEHERALEVGGDPWGLADPISHDRARPTDSERVAAVAACGEPTDPAEMQERERASGPVCSSCRLDIDEADALRAYPGHAAVGGAS